MDQPDSALDPVDDNTEPSEPRNLTLMQRIVGVFLYPGDTFEHLDRKPDWVAPMVILTVVALVFTNLVLPISLPEQMAKQEEKMEERGMSRAQIDQAMAMGEKIGRISGLVGSIIGPVIHMLLIALFFWFVGNVILGGQTTYLKMFSVCTYTALIGALDMAIKLPLILYKKTVDINLNLGVLLPESLTETLLGDIMKVLDIFIIWRLAAMAVGFAVLYKFSMEKAAWTMGVLFALYVGMAVAVLQLVGG
jgi:hypothetical protein